MLFRLLYPLHEYISVFNVFRYITFRSALSTLTALLISFGLGSWLIRKLRNLQIGQNIRPEGPQTHHTKKGTPTMGGLLIILVAGAIGVYLVHLAHVDLFTTQFSFPFFKRWTPDLGWFYVPFIMVVIIG